MRSIASRAPAKAASRWGAETATITLGSLSGTGPDPVLGRGGAQPVARRRLVEDRGDPRLRHLGVGLVLEPLDLAGHALEHDDRPGARVAHAGDSASASSGAAVTRGHGRGSRRR